MSFPLNWTQTDTPQLWREDHDWEGSRGRTHVYTWCSNIGTDTAAWFIFGDLMCAGAETFAAHTPAVVNTTPLTSIATFRSERGRGGDQLHSNRHPAAVSHEVLHLGDEHQLVSWVRNDTKQTKSLHLVLLQEWQSCNYFWSVVSRKHIIFAFLWSETATSDKYNKKCNITWHGSWQLFSLSCFISVKLPCFVMEIRPVSFS